MTGKRARKLVEIFILILALYLANQRALVWGNLFPDTTNWYSSAWIGSALWVVVLAGLLWVLAQTASLRSYVQQWRANFLLVVFLYLALLSIVWSIYRAICVLGASLVGAYIGLRYPLEGLLRILFWFGVVLVILSFELALLVPVGGRMLWEPYNGAWRGIYWHRNHLGSLTALLSAVFLIRFVTGGQRRQKTVLWDGLFYVLSAVLIVLSDSATGKIILLVTSASVLVAAAWCRVAHRLRRKHYAVMLILIAIAGLIAFSNLNLILGLFNRDTSLTGRLPMWRFLLEEVVSRRPGLGYGFGAIWSSGAFRAQAQDAAGWGFPVLIADNGFLDILLHLGVTGLLVVFLLFAALIVRAARFALADRTVSAFFPLIFLEFALLSNTSFSLLIESEEFVWLVFVALLFLTHQKVSGRSVQERNSPSQYPDRNSRQ